MEEKQLIQKYISQFNNNEKLAYEIAKQHLETSFDISRSIGFLEFKENEKFRFNLKIFSCNAGV